MSNFNTKMQKVLNALSNIVQPNCLFTDPVDCFAYAYDNSRQYFPPDGVVFAKTTQEIQQIVKLCHDYEIPLTARGRGTGTAGGSLPEQGGIALSLEKMRQIIEFNPQNRYVIAEPGVLNQEVQNLVKPDGFFWAPDPSSQAYCSIGGNLATCAGGPHAVKYGVTRDHVLGLKAVTGTGELIQTGCYTTKGVVGYDLTRLMIGSEGTLGIITEATLKLTPLPAKRAGITAHYHSLEACAEAVVQIMNQPACPSALELLDTASLDLLRSRYDNLIPDNAAAMLMIEVDGSAREISETQEAILTALQHSGLIEAKAVSDDQSLWAARKALSPLLRDIAPKKINEDIAVPIAALPELFHQLKKLSTHYQIANVNFGHAGNGNIHVNLLIDPEDPIQLQKAEACLDEIFTVVLNLNGTLSGEHGVGMAKRPFISREIDIPTIHLMKQIKAVFDPKNILNPGKLFE